MRDKKNQKYLEADISEVPIESGDIVILETYTDRGNTYHVDGRHVKQEHSARELMVGRILSGFMKKTVYIVPVVEYPEFVSTPDYITADGEKYDHKGIGKSAYGKNALSSRIQGMERQAYNFVFDVDKECALSNEDLRSQIRRIYMNERTSFVNELIVVRGERVIMYFRREKIPPWSGDLTL